MKKAYIHFAEGFEEIEALTIVDVLRRAEISAQMISVTGKLEVAGAHGITVKTDLLFEDTDYDEADILILPGGMPGSNNLNAHDGLKLQLRKFNDENKPLGAICAAPLVLGGLQILKGKDAVCYPGFENTLTGAKVGTEPAVRSGNVVTGRGPGTALKFSLEIVKMLKGEDLAKNLANALIAN
ncbi:MAG: DJ-1/PfpI family protein [Bacteroidales bacterium]|nr:DJ-1/PfpI family protein [Bacteroidales bacterium]